MTCSKCHQSKLEHELRKGRKVCKACTNSRFMEWKKSSGFVEYQSQHRLSNLDRINATQSAYNSKRAKSDPNFKLRGALRNRISSLIKSGSAVRDLGCTVEELRLRFESMFQPGMTWDNHGDWHIDHIVPLSAFDLTNRDQFLKACHYTNLQPLWASDNLRKSDKFDTIGADGDLR